MEINGKRIFKKINERKIANERKKNKWIQEMVKMK